MTVEDSSPLRESSDISADNASAETQAPADSSLEGELLPPQTDTAPEIGEVPEGMDLPTAQRRLEALTLERDKLKEEVIRQQAEQENLRKRMQRELEKAHKYALEKFAEELLPIKDSMEMGLEAARQETADVQTLREGGELMHNMMANVLEKFAIKEVHPQGEKFDPNFHEAMSMVPNPEVESNTVLWVHQKGYTLHDRLLRPARVVVAKNS